MRRTPKILALVLAVGSVLLAVAHLLRSPSADRIWAEDMRRLAEARVEPDGRVALREIRDWRYAPDAVVSRDYFDAVYDPDDLVDLWLYEQVFDQGGWVAHTFLVFEFDESYGRGRYLALSMEARREDGEDYSILRGLLRGFEAAHVWATEADVVGRRVDYRNEPLNRYRLEVSPEARARIFTRMAEETMALAARPRWYNTALYNCTSSLIRYANEAEPGAIPLHYSFVLTGRVDAYLTRLGYVDPSGSRVITREDLRRRPLRPEGGA